MGSLAKFRADAKGLTFEELEARKTEFDTTQIKLIVLRSSDENVTD